MGIFGYRRSHQARVVCQKGSQTSLGYPRGCSDRVANSIDKHPDSGATTGDLLKYKAAEFWNKLPEYNGVSIPIFSDGWLGGFKKRMGLKAHRRHGEAGSAVINDESERIMEEIREEGKKYEADCIYNFDETGYYWKMKPDRSLTTFEESGRKKDKARITVGLTCNVTGTDRLPLWFIGTAIDHTAFGRSISLDKIQ